MFEIFARDPSSSARRGRLATNHAAIETPCFMPVGTRGALKGVAFDWLESDAWDCRVVLANTYHLMARPGLELILRAGGLHQFMGWPRAILTDSGGFQVMSLASRRRILGQRLRPLRRSRSRPRVRRRDYCRLRRSRSSKRGRPGAQQRDRASDVL